MLRPLLILTCCLLFHIGSANAQDFVIIASEGAGEAYRPGRSFTAGEKISLRENARVTLINAAGGITQLKGPYNGELSRAGSTGTGSHNTLSPVVAMLESASRKTVALGATRAVTDATGRIGKNDPTDIWTINADIGGSACIDAPQAQLQRKLADAPQRVKIWPMTGRPRDVEWPRGKKRLTLDDADLVSGTQLSIANGNGGIAILLWRRPDDIAPAATGDLLLWFSSKGCKDQAMRLIAHLSEDGVNQK